MTLNVIHNTDCLTGLRELPDKSVHCCVTSPPYYGLRNYGHEGQIGLEETPEAYVQKLVEVFREVRRVLRDDGTLWLNLGDSYASDYKGSGGPSAKQDSNAGSRFKPIKFNHNCKPKDLIGIPWMVAFALRADGWYLRQDIIWNKPNPMPESVTDRCTKSHEYIFLLSKSQRYYYDQEAIKTETIEPDDDRESRQSFKSVPTDKINGIRNAGIYPMANKRSVWTVTTKPFSDAHFATFPQDLIVDCIKAGSSEHGCCPDCGKPMQRMVNKETVFRERPNEYGERKQGSGMNNINQTVAGTITTTIGFEPSCNCGKEPTPAIILDPFMGAGTTAIVARKLGRNYVGFEINSDYIGITQKRINAELGMFI